MQPGRTSIITGANVSAGLTLRSDSSFSQRQPDARLTLRCGSSLADRSAPDNASPCGSTESLADCCQRSLPPHLAAWQRFVLTVPSITLHARPCGPTAHLFDTYANRSHTPHLAAWQCFRSTIVARQASLLGPTPRRFIPRSPGGQQEMTRVVRRHSTAPNSSGERQQL